MDLSLVIPAYNEKDSIPELLAQITAAVKPLNFEYEIIFIDDGSNDGTLECIREMTKTYPQVKAISFRRNYGKSPALSEGFKVCQGRYVVTMDSDLQDDPQEIPALLDKLNEGSTNGPNANP